MMGRTKPWYLRISLVNRHTGQAADISYPCDKFQMLESMALCGIPYGSGDYSYLAKSRDGFAGTGLQPVLAGVIEHPTHPPSMQELNFLARRLQAMPSQMRTILKREIANWTEGTIGDVINASHRLLSTDALYDGISMADRAVLWEENDPYFRVHLVRDSDDWFEDKAGVWVSSPASEAELAAAASAMGVDSCDDLVVNEAHGVVRFGYCLLPSEINRWAAALKEHQVGRQLCKYKAILDFENCSDVEQAIQLAGMLDAYEHFPEADWDKVLDSFVKDASKMDYDEQMELAEEVGIQMTNYGVIREVGEAPAPCLDGQEQQQRALQWSALIESPNPLLELAGQIYELSDGLCEAGAGPGGIGVSTKDGAKVHLLLSFDPLPVQGQTIFPTEIERYKVKVTGQWAESGESIRPEEARALLRDPDPPTRRVAAVLCTLSPETHTVSTEDCHEAFALLAERGMRKAYGAPEEAPPDRQMDTEEPDIGPTLCQI